MPRGAAAKVSLIAVAALVLIGLSGCGGSTPAAGGQATADQAAADIATLSRLSDDWDKAIVRKDEAAIAGNMAEDFRMIDRHGTIEAKPAFVAGIMDPKLSIDPYTVEEFDVRIYGDTALLSGTTRMTGKFDGQPFESNYRYIDIYVRTDGTWKIVSVQITGLGAPAS